MLNEMFINLQTFLSGHIILTACSRFKHKRTRTIQRMTRAWNQMLLTQAIAPAEHGVG